MEFIELSAEEVKSLQQSLNGAASLRKLRVSSDGNSVKFKINEGVWSPPLGRKGEPY